MTRQKVLRSQLAALTDTPLDVNEATLDELTASNAATAVDGSVVGSETATDGAISDQGLEISTEQHIGNIMPSNIAERVSEWNSKVMALGKGKLGPFDEVTMAFIEGLELRFNGLNDRIVQLKEEMVGLQEDRLFYEAKEKDLFSRIVALAAAEKNPHAVQVQSLNDELADLERRENELKIDGERIATVRDLQLDEYDVMTPAAIVASEIKSNRKRLFAFAFMVIGGVLLTPSTIIEILRLRPTPVSVMSRRWNLPVLSVQLSGAVPKADKKEKAAIQQHETRLMALRIQQSLFKPTGRVVLFSGLDHEESPMTLIRSLARCFSQREESVLIIQTLPCQVEIAKRQNAEKSGQKAGRPGVAEFLAGEVNDISDLIISTGVTGVEFLPGGCTVAASEAMASSRLTGLIDQLRGKYSMILVSGPSTLHPADLQMVAARADGIIFTVNKKSMNVVYGEEVINDLIELGAPILGLANQPMVAKKPFPSEKPEKEQTSAKLVVG